LVPRPGHPAPPRSAGHPRAGTPPPIAWRATTSALAGGLAVTCLATTGWAADGAIAGSGLATAATAAVALLLGAAAGAACQRRRHTGGLWHRVPVPATGPRGDDGDTERRPGAGPDGTASQQAPGQDQTWLRLAARAAELGIIEWDMAASLLRLDARASAIAGGRLAPDTWVPTDAPEVQAWLDAIHPEDRARRDAAIAALLERGNDSEGWEYRLRRPDGAWVWVAARGLIVERAPATSRPLLGIVVLQDVTAARTAEAALRESETRLRLAMQGACLGLVDFDFRRNMAWVDAGASAMTGGILPPETWMDLAGPQSMAWLARMHPDDRPRRDASRRALRDGLESGLSLDYRAIQADGTVRWFAFRSAIAERDPATGQCHRAFGVVCDVTERETAAAALRDSEARLRLVTDTARAGLVVLEEGPHGPAYRYANRAYLDIIGHAGEDLRGKLVADVLPDRYRVVAPMLRLAFEGERQNLEWSPPSPHPDGVARRVAVTLDASRDCAGTPLVVGVVVDVTERWEAEQRLRAEVAAREAAQARAADAERMQALGRLAGGIAHDFNNVLQTVQEAASLIEGSPAKAETVALYARMIGKAADRGISVTRRLLAFARHGELRADIVEVRPLLENLSEMLRFTLGAGIRIDLDTAAGLPPLLADKGQIETVLINLATNARDAMPAGGVLTLTAAAETVGAPGRHPAGLAPATYVRLSVTDTGAGMDPATLARVTEPFFTTKAAGIGTGLGLAMVKGFAEQSGGGLALASTPGEGTVVTLWLPAAPADARPSVTPAGSAARIASARLLLVDDDALVRETLLAQLEDQGFIVAGAEDGAAALALLDAGIEVDALVTDLSMPHMDGISLIGTARLRRPGLPAILLTGTPPPEPGTTEDHGVPPPFLVVHKPIRAAQLAERLADVLEKPPVATVTQGTMVG
jgi:PAS domain S-box-containing protein